MRTKIAQLVHQVDAQVVVFDPHVHVHAADEQLPGQDLVFEHQSFITRAFGDGLVGPFRKGMGAARDDVESVFLCDFVHRSAGMLQMLVHFLDGGTHRCAHLHLTLEHFGGDRISHFVLSAFQEELHRRTEFAGFGVNDHVLFFNADGEIGGRFGHGDGRFDGWDDRRKYNL